MDGGIVHRGHVQYVLGVGVGYPGGIRLGNFHNRRYCISEDVVVAASSVDDGSRRGGEDAPSHQHAAQLVILIVVLGRNPLPLRERRYRRPIVRVIPVVVPSVFLLRLGDRRRRRGRDDQWHCLGGVGSNARGIVRSCRCRGRSGSGGILRSWTAVSRLRRRRRLLHRRRGHHLALGRRERSLTWPFPDDRSLLLLLLCPYLSFVRILLV
mmetsp:Transcript_10217/g.25037  ORF Transcript_10217/g.25037 Transcript_10217/m.25037 type:complete len:210 (+) Transcript_10217:1943-2572(+)